MHDKLCGIKWWLKYRYLNDEMYDIAKIKKDEINVPTSFKRQPP